ncbi:MAG: M43 family zinc metalloprotease [Bacteroidota bacterium]
MKSIFTLVAFLSVAFVSTAQTALQKCGTFDLMQQKEQQTPGYQARVNACFDNAKQLAERNKYSRAGNDTVYRVQTVFHIVYTSPNESIPDSVIFSQLEVLNEDYRRKNADTVKTRDIFKPVAGDAGIEFYLATTDPDGNPTTGITRTAGTPGFLGFDPFSDNVKSSAAGGKDAWPTDRYLNVWVCNVFFGLGVLGYAFPPDNAPNWPSGSNTDSAKQGVVLHFPVVGRNSIAPIDPTVTRGRSLVHELGHYFGLRHIWGDGDCTEDDGLAETPESSAANQQTCDTLVNSCIDSLNDHPDMIENYMDYSDDRCQNMFTNDQIGIMRAMLQSSRAGIATPVVVSSIKNDIGSFERVDVFPVPSSGIIHVRAGIKNNVTYSCEIYNVIGEKLATATNLTPSTPSDQYHSIDLTSQPAGVYFVRFHAGSETVMKKFSLVK